MITIRTGNYLCEAALLIKAIMKITMIDRDDAAATRTWNLTVGNVYQTVLWVQLHMLFFLSFC